MPQTYDQWRLQCDRLTTSLTGLDIDSFDDWNWYANFEDGVPPVEAVDDFLYDVCPILITIG